MSAEILLTTTRCPAGDKMKPTVAAEGVCVVLALAMLALVACGSAPPQTSQPSAIPPETAAAARATATLPQAAATVARSTQGSASFPLSEPGTYHVGMRSVVSEDPSRDHRSIAITVWYPALGSQESTGRGPTRDAPLDLSGAPYPLLLSSTKAASIFAPFLVTHGFTWASVDKLDYYIPWNTQLVMQPLDILFALDQVASSPPVGLEGAIDAEHAGAIGYSFDGYNALALSGARVDPEFYLEQCANAPSMEPALGSFWIDYYCRMSGNWAQFADVAGAVITASDDGLWQPITDARIRAVMPMAPEGAWLFGDRGLAAVDRPTLIIGATEDVDCDYWREAAYIFDHLGTPDKSLISFIGRGHMMVFEPDMVARMAHFATAFFGHHLQGRQDFEQYFSDEFVARHDDLAWGVYTGD